jgi:hypothetical protein
MERIAILREQASLLRALATSFDIPLMRDQSLEIAARCDAIARSLEENPQSADVAPPASADPRP